MVTEVAQGYRKVAAAVGAGMVALVACAGIALADPSGPVQPGVTVPVAPVTPTAPAPGGDQSAQLHSATPQNDNSGYTRRRSPATPTTTAPPSPREVHIGPLSAPVPNAVPNSIVDGVNQTNQDLQNVISPSTTPTPQPKR
ncbi:hypothetical protein KO481_31890 [Nocardia sp. NEAU-G5]|uniref:Lipoprotein n=1 Tax=Nocardia albiluteola TaxID=2842303 RepID=A0ABS6B8M6_9NOCA|nr:hypothetical protein [Nocardia albiluteola]MBU3066105.1 hypothetical protein [Nocardia albiluteola]